MNHLHFKQLKDSESSTFTYILWDSKSKESVIIDPVLSQFKRDIQLIDELGLKVKFIFETHIHADHITSAYKLKKITGGAIALSAKAKAKGVDYLLKDGDQFFIGPTKIEVLATPGHTQSCLSFVCENKVFTGDTLLIRGCGRTDFQGGSSKELFQSVRNKLFCLPEETLVYPGHDYKGFSSSRIIEEKQFNPRLKLSIKEAEFIDIMNGLELSPPQKMNVAVPANLNEGVGS